MMTSRETASAIERELREALAATHVGVVDESAAHAGHAGARSGAGHFAVTVVSPRFEGLALVARHRMVHAALSVETKKVVHALSLATLTPAEWEGGGGG